MGINRALRFVLLLLVPFGLSACLNFTAGLNLATSDIDLERIDRALAENPDNGHAWLLRGRSNLSLGNYSSARRAFNRALRVQPSLEEARLGIGVTYLEQKRWSRAAQTFEEWAQLNPQSSGAWSGLAAARYGMGEMAATQQAATRALALDQNNMNAHRLLGEVAYARGEHEAALRHWRDACRDGSLTGELEPAIRDLEKYVRKYGSE